VLATHAHSRHRAGGMLSTDIKSAAESAELKARHYGRALKAWLRNGAGEPGG
jgi:hypothetical protein